MGWEGGQRLRLSYPFVPYTSDHRRLALNIGEIRRDWTNRPVLEELLAAHEAEDWSLRSHPEGFTTGNYDERSYRMRNDNVATLRAGFSQIAKWRLTTMGPEAELIWKLNILAENARQGHGVVPRQIGQTTDQVVAMLGLDPYLPRKGVQVLAHDCFEGYRRLLRLVHEHKDESLDTKLPEDTFIVRGRPLLDMQILYYARPTLGDVIEFLRGSVLMDAADSFEHRKRTKERWPVCVDGITPFKLGGGVKLGYVRDAFPEELRFKDLEVTEENIPALTEQGFFSFDPRQAYYPEVVPRYVRLDQEPGVSDIGVFLRQRTIHPYRFLGAVVMDGLDSYGLRCFEPFIGCLPEYTAAFIERNYARIMSEELVSDDEKQETIYLGARANVKRLNSSQSHRNLNHDRHTLTPVEAILFGDHNLAVVAEYEHWNKGRFRPNGTRARRRKVNLDHYRRIVEERQEMFTHLAA